MNDDILTMVYVMYKVRRALKRERRGYQRALYMRFGITEGLTEDQFNVCVSLLEQHGWLTVDKGTLGRPILVFNQQQVNASVYSPDEVIAHAMQCPPITEELLSGAPTK
jgi:hypothetical protein